MSRALQTAITGALFAATLCAAPALAGPGCSIPPSFSLPNVTSLTATLVTSGEFPWTPQVKLIGLPKFCRIQGVSKPSGDSYINFELWIPFGGTYNGKYQQVGNGGFSGVIPYAALAEGIRRGYATAGTDDGSQSGGLSSFANGHPEKITDYAFRALKETTNAAKTIITKLTGGPPKYSYFHGCSNGGREALMEAQRYPKDFDGIIVGSPANFLTHQAAGFSWNVQSLVSPPTGFVPSTQLSQLSGGVLKQCVALDGGAPTDKFLTDPRLCHPNLSAIKCPMPAGPPCFTPDQQTAINKIYQGPVDPVTHSAIFPGFDPGTESGPLDWPLWITAMPPFGTPILAQGMEQIASFPPPLSGVSAQFLFGAGFLADFVVASPPYNIFTFPMHTGVPDVDAQLADRLNSTDPDLRPFAGRHGKIIEYVGWADAAVAPRQGINYYTQVHDFLAADAAAHGHPYSVADTQSFYRLFMAPGMAHCVGGPGPSAFGNYQNGPVVDPAHDVLEALEQWVEHGVAPETIIATKFRRDVPRFGIEAQRPLCVYPKLPRWDGVGDPSRATSFTCVETKHRLGKYGLPEIE